LLSDPIVQWEVCIADKGLFNKAWQCFKWNTSSSFQQQARKFLLDVIREKKDLDLLVQVLVLKGVVPYLRVALPLICDCGARSALDLLRAAGIITCHSH
jgi:hypothetical protein